MSKLMRLQTLILAAAVLAGCQQTPPPNHGEVFAPEDQPTDTSRLLAAQVDRGARADATLYACHFDGQYLNSLGMTKLDQMLRADNDAPVEVWLAVPDDDKFSSRRMSVAAYLKEQGLSADQVLFSRGANPASDHPAAESLKDLTKMDSDAQGSSGGGSSSSSSSTGLGNAP
jgi:hypothetical protein